MNWIKINSSRVPFACQNVSGLIVQRNPGCLGCDQVILRAVGQAGSCLSYASEELRADPAIALAALSSDVEAFEFVAPRLWEDADVEPMLGNLRMM